MTFKITLDMGPLQAELDKIGRVVEGGSRPIAQAAAQVIYDEIKKNVDAIGKKTGNLSRSIYQVYSQEHSNANRSEYHLSWNAKKAPHGGLVEYGHLQRYRYYQNAAGEVRLMVRPGMEGQPRPKRRSSQAAKDAYWVALPTPIQVAARPFVRPAVNKLPEAIEAGLKVLQSRLTSGEEAP